MSTTLAFHPYYCIQCNLLMDRSLRGEHLSMHHGIAPVREDDSSVYPPMTAQQHIAALVAMGAKQVGPGYALPYGAPMMPIDSPYGTLILLPEGAA